MGRPVYPHELSDPDFSWLLDSFQENSPEYHSISSGSLPIVLIRDESYPQDEVATVSEESSSFPYEAAEKQTTPKDSPSE